MRVILGTAITYYAELMDRSLRSLGEWPEFDIDVGRAPVAARQMPQQEAKDALPVADNV